MDGPQLPSDPGRAPAAGTAADADEWEGAPRIDRLLARAVEEQVAEKQALQAALDGVHHGLAQLGERLTAVEEAIGRQVESDERIRQYLAAEFTELGKVVRAALAELTDAVRRDLGRLPGALADHRAAIASDVRAALAEAGALFTGEEQAPVDAGDDVPHDGPEPDERA